MREVQRYLRANPHFKYVWLDYWCLPQGKRTASEQREFDGQLRNINLLYLGFSVLILVDLSYISRFWTLFESWLSFQVATAEGLRPSPADRRVKITTIHLAENTILDQVAEQRS